MAQKDSKDPRYERTLRNPYNWHGESWRYTNKNEENLSEGSVDLTVPVQMALSGLLRAPQSVNSTILVETLRGIETRLVLQSGMNAIKTFGVGSDLSHHAWHIILEHMQGLGLIKGFDMFQKISVVESDQLRAYLRGERPVTLSAAQFRALERDRAIRLLTNMLTERDPDGKTEHSRENRLMITPAEAERADECYAVLSGELSMVVQHITNPIDPLQIMLRNTVTKICVRDNIDPLESFMGIVPSSYEVEIISTRKPQSLGDLELCCGKPQRWFEKFANPIVETVSKHELLISQGLNQTVAPKL
jgi:superfamily II DNA helicase RecQ